MIYTREFPITYGFRILNYNPQAHIVELVKKATSVGPEQGGADEVTFDEAVGLETGIEKIVADTYQGLKKDVTEGEIIDDQPCPETLTLAEFDIDGSYIEPCTLSDGGFINMHGLGSTSVYKPTLPTIADAVAGMTDPQFVPLGRHIAIYDRFLDGYDIPQPEEPEERRGIGDFNRTVKAIATYAHSGSVYLPTPLTCWGETHPAGWNSCTGGQIIPPFLFLFGSHYNETCVGGWLYHYLADAVMYMLDTGSGFVGHKYTTAVEYATAVYYSLRSFLATGEHTIEMCQAAGADGCMANYWNRLEYFVLREDPQNKFFKRTADPWVIRYHVPIIDCSRRVKLVNGNPSIVPALIGAALLGGLTTFGFLSATMGAGVAGAGRRTPRRHT